MTLVSIIAISVGAAFLLGGLAWFAYEPPQAGRRRAMLAHLPVEFLMPRTPREIADVEQTLATIQSQIADTRLPKGEREQLVRERSRITWELLAALRQDFDRLGKLSGACSEISPTVSRVGGTPIFVQELRLITHYTLALTMLTIGEFPTGSIWRLRSLIRERALILATRLKAIDSEILANTPPNTAGLSSENKLL